MNVWTLLLLWAATACAQPYFLGVRYDTADASGSCTNRSPLWMNQVSGTLFGCDSGSWVILATPGGVSGTVTSVALSRTNDTNVTATITGSPITTAGTINMALGWSGSLAVARGGTGASTLTGILQGNGTSAVTAIGLPGSASQYLDGTGAFSTPAGAGTVTNAAPLTANLPVIGAGSNAVSVGTRSGNTTAYVTTTGAQTSGDCVKIDANGNHIANGSACGSGGGSSITSGTYASLPATCTTNDLYFTTNSYYTVFRCTATNTWTPFSDGRQNALAAVCASWTVINGASGSATCGNVAGVPVLSTTSNVVGFEALAKAVPSAPYTKTFALTVAAVSTDLSPLLCAVGWSDGTATTNAIHILGFFIYSGINGVASSVASYTSFAWAGGVANFTGAEMVRSGRFLYAQLEDNNTNRIFRVSGDGNNWITLYSVARTSPFTPTHYLFGCGKQSAGTGNPWNVGLVSDE